MGRERKERHPINLQADHNGAARDMNNSLRSITNAQKLVGEKHATVLINRRQLIPTMALRLVNPDISPEEIAQRTNLPVEYVLEDLQLARESFLWAADLAWVEKS